MMIKFMRLFGCTALAALITVIAGPGSAQQLTDPPAASRYKYSTPMPQGVASPDTVEARFDTLNFFGGVPDQASTDKIYDNLDYQRAVQRPLR